MDKSLASWLEGQAMEFSASRCFQHGKSFGCRQSSDASQCGWILLVSIIARHGSVLSTVNPYCSNWVRQRVTYRATLTTGCFRCLQQSLRSKAAFWRPRSPRPSETAFFEWRCDVAIFRALRPAHTCFGLSIQQSQCKVIENKLKLESIWNLLSRWLFKWGNSQASFELIPEAPSLIWSPAYPPSGRSVWRAVESTENPRY